MNRRSKAQPWMALATLVLAACGDDDGPTDPSGLECSGGTALSVGATVNGTLDVGDDLDEDAAYLDRFALAVGQGGTIEITMRSSEVDSWLWLRTEGGGLIESDDDSGGGTSSFDARIVRSLDRGCYLVEATTFFGQSGAYTLTVQRE